MDYILTRLREPSTYAGIATVVGLGAGFLPNAAAWQHEVGLIGAAIMGLLAILLPEAKK